MSKHEATEYWQLVHQLSLLGWYRAGLDGDGSPDLKAWRFQAGHTTDAANAQSVMERSIAASSETAAMRALLRKLRRSPSASHSATASSKQVTPHEDSQSFDASLLWTAPRAPHQGGRPQ